MSATRAPRIMVIDSGASWSTADVTNGLLYGLKVNGCELILYRLAARIDHAARFLNTAWRQKRRSAQRALERATDDARPALTAQLATVNAERPTKADVFYQGGIGALEMALRHLPDAVIVVSAMFLHPDVLSMLKRAGLRVFVLFTESPYDLEKELKIAGMRAAGDGSPLVVDGCWMNERSVQAAFRAVNPRSGYLPHAWHPETHKAGPQPGDELVAAHDVVFVGSAFRERIEFLSAIDWSGIDLGLYGQWKMLPSRSPLRRFVRGDIVTNAQASALYRRAKVGLNLYRTSIGWGANAPQIAHAESLNPRAYELAACGSFSISSFRSEVAEVFGARVPTFRSATEAAALIRTWLADAAGRERIAAELPACVAESSWRNRAASMIGDLQQLLAWRAA